MTKPRNSTTLATSFALVGLGLTLGVGIGRAADTTSVGSDFETGTPMTVSPGSAQGSRIGDTCPTFSWGAAAGAAGAAGAEGYELIVYRLGKETGEAMPVLLEAVAGSASSWTPSLDECLERGDRYAWSVRAFAGEQMSDWSMPSLFEVTAAPSAVEFENALDVVRRYVRRRDQVDPVDGNLSTPPASPSPLPKTAGIGTLPAPHPLVPAGTQMIVDGNVDAVSFSGSGFLLTDLNPDPPCFSADRRFVDCGNGTITDGVTGLVYLKNSNCFGQHPYIGAHALAALVKDGLCGLADGSHRGDWRLPTVKEWQTLLKPGCATVPKLVGNGTPTTGCFADNSGANGWIFVAEPSFDYWSSATFDSLALYHQANVASFSSGDVANTVTGKTVSAYFWMVRGGR